jgi:membrane protein DedA with SNARE-associated domain/membrane-associated phospholipid phosphatase
MIDAIASHILALPVWVALVLVFALPALESSAFVGFVFPGEVALVLGGVIAYQGRLSLLAVLAAGIGGAVAGDSVGYLVGRRYGRQLLEGTLGRFVNHRHFDRAQGYLAERGGKAVFLGRFTAALRVLVPGLAGMSRMRYLTFAGYNVAGGVAWGTMVVLLGYLGGSSWRHVEHLASRIGLGALAALVAAFGCGYLLRRSRGGWVRRQLRRVRESGPVTSAVTRFPRQAAWVAHRVDPRSRAGLPLTCAVAIAVAATWSFLGITQDVVAHEELALFDPRVHAWVLAHRMGWLTVAMRVLTWLGSNAVVGPVAIVGAIAIGRSRRSWRPAVTLGVLYGWAVIGHAVVADLVHRPRPAVTDWLSAASGWAYPSGHTVQATVIYGALLLLLVPPRSAVAVRLLTAVTVVLIGVVAFSRVYLGVHWLSDVVGSMSLGVALLSIWQVVHLVLTSDDEVPRRAVAR